jgi:hypothetical protein
MKRRFLIRNDRVSVIHQFVAAAKTNEAKTVCGGKKQIYVARSDDIPLLGRAKQGNPQRKI